MKSRIIKCLIVLGIMSNIIKAANPFAPPRAHFWAKTIDMSTPGSVISSNTIEVNALSALTIGAATRIYVAGTFTGSITLPGGVSLTSSGGKDIFIGSYNPDNGNFYGATKIGGVNDDVATGIALRTGSTHANVRVMVSANYNFNTISNIAFATTNGAFVTPGVVNAGQGRVSGITTNGTFFYLAGTFTGPLSFPNPGGTPFTLSLASGLTQDVFVAKIQTSAVISSSTVVTRSLIKPFSTIAGLNEIGDITYAPNGRLYITGAYLGTLQFNNNVLSKIISTSSYNEIFVASLNPGGSTTATYPISFDKNDQQTSNNAEAEFYDFGPQYQRIIANANGVYITGLCSGTADFNGLSIVTPNPIPSTFSQYAFIVKYGFVSPGNLGVASNMNGIYNTNLGDEVTVKGIANDGTNVYVTGTSGKSLPKDPLPAQFFGVTETNDGGLIAKFDNSLNNVWQSQITRATDLTLPIPTPNLSYACGNALAFNNCKLYLGGYLYDATGIASSQARINNFGQQNLLTRNSIRTGLISSLSANVGCDPQTICANANAIYTTSNPFSFGLNVYSDLMAGNSYSWSTITTPASAVVTYNSTTFLDPTVTFSTDGDYVLNLTITGPICPQVIPFNIRVRKVAFQILQSNPIPTSYSGLGCPPLFIPPILIGAPAITGLTYSWTGPAGISNPSIAQPTITQQGNYTVTVNTTNLPGQGCNNPWSVSVSATINGEIICDGDGARIASSNETIDSNTKIENAISVFPNPTSDLLNIKIDLAGFVTSKIKIFDMAGKNLITQELNKETNNKVDVSNLENGVYLYEIIIDNQKMKSSKLVINK